MLLLGWDCFLCCFCMHSCTVSFGLSSVSLWRHICRRAVRVHVRPVGSNHIVCMMHPRLCFCDHFRWAFLFLLTLHVVVNIYKRDLNGARESRSMKIRRYPMHLVKTQDLSNDYVVAKLGLDIAEKELSRICQRLRQS